jgi:farnesyl diphosphate synthase
MREFEEFLDKNLPKVESFHPVYEDALGMMLQAGGKRFRPKLLLAVVKAYERGLVDSAKRVALALEMFHTYSLIHDDLPAMDDAPLRRGHTTIHAKYDEATAILAGDALNTDSFYLIATSAFRDDVKVELIKILSQNGGGAGMVLGQALDLYFEQKPLKLDEVITLHKNKTAKLIAGSLEMGAVIVQLPKDKREKLYSFGMDLGLLFQIQDDILDATVSQQKAGKPTNSDGDKNSFVNLLGLDGALDYADELAFKLQESFEEFDSALKYELGDLIKKYLHRHRENF